MPLRGSLAACPTNQSTTHYTTPFCAQRVGSTSEIIEAYVNCKTKAYLMLQGEHGTGTDYQPVLFTQLISE